MSVYVSDYAARHAAAVDAEDAQRIVAVHAISSADGRCVRCDVPAVECELRVDALALLAREQMLPRRYAGATRPELIGARRLRVDPPRRLQG